MRFITVIVVAAGRSERLKSRISKPLIKINSKPILVYSLEVFNKLSQVNDIVVVANSLNIEEVNRLVNRYKIRKVKKIVLGGARRQDSVLKGLFAMNPQTDLVLVHDGGRPFIDKKVVLEVINKASKTGAAVAGIPVKATLKKVTSSPGQHLTSQLIIERTVDRSDLWEAQTPQGFRADLLFAAYNKFRNDDVTDDASIVEKLGIPVNMVNSDARNIKITTPEDLIIAQAIAKIRK